MAEKCIILCADHRCKHNCPGSYYGTCQHPDHANLGVYGGIDRMYMETCPRSNPLPPQLYRRLVKPIIYHGSAGCGKSYLTQFEDPTDLLEQGIVPVTSLISGNFNFTAEDVLSAIEQFNAGKLKHPETSYPPFTWDEPGFSLHSEEENHGNIQV